MIEGKKLIHNLLMHVCRFSSRACEPLCVCECDVTLLGIVCVAALCVVYCCRFRHRNFRTNRAKLLYF